MKNPPITDMLLIKLGSRIKDALKQLEETERKTLFVVDAEKRLVGSLTDGDIRRWILAEGGLGGTVETICNKTPSVAATDYDLEWVKTQMLEKRIGTIPVVNSGRQVVDVLFWESVFGDTEARKPVRRIDLPVVIMAGGKGTRLDPFTRILPKPLIPIGERTVIEIIIDSFVASGVGKFYISVNYKSKIIKSYFEELNPRYAIEYLYEEKPLGTAGSLSGLRGLLNGPFIVTNCDVIIRTDYCDIVEHHRASGNDITLIASLKHYNIPYGICEIVNGGTLSRIREKPEYDFLVNTGMYLLQPQVLNLIPENELFHMTDLIAKVQKTGGRIGVFPIGDKAWIDTGEWIEYKNALKQIDSMLG